MLNFLRRRQRPRLPDWRSDWLYRLVFRKVEGFWEFCKKNKDSRYLQYVLVEEWSSAEGIHCGGKRLRLWIRDTGGLRQIPLRSQSENTPKSRSRIFPFVIVSFYVFPDKTHVVFCHQEADTAGSGVRYVVTGGPDNAELEIDPSGGFWIS